MPDSHSLDIAAVRRAFGRAAKTYDDAAVLQSEVRDRLLSRLEIVRGEPQAVLDLGAGTAHASRALKARFPRAAVLAVDFALPMLQQARRQLSFFRQFERVSADAGRLPLRTESVDWCVSNLLLPWCDDVERVFAEVHRVLKPGGLFSFTTFGPDTLHELRAAWSRVDSHAHVHRFADMHDVGDALVRTGFAEPVMDAERIVLTYRDVRQLTREIKATGATTALQNRARHLAARRSLHALSDAYEPLRVEGRLPVTFEIVYGQAWRAESARERQPPGETRIGIENIGGRKR